jgi:hypothetical protein
MVVVEEESDAIILGVFRGLALIPCEIDLVEAFYHP